MTESVHSERGRVRAVLTDWRFVRHFLEMLVAMLVGMVALAPLWPPLPHSTELHTIVMATNMTVGMAVWMAIRRHRWIAIAEMGLAMYVPFLVLFPLLWVGWLTAGGVMVAGHVLMLPAMVLAMLRRPAEYTC
jgi:flagellar biosynthetic protein FliP